MELYHEILLQYLMNSPCEVRFPDIQMKNVTEVIEMQCYQTLEKIQNVITDDQLDDKECFERIEKIVQALENAGVNCGNRHDFG